MKRIRFAKELRLRAAALRKIARELDPDDEPGIMENLVGAADDLERRALRFDAAKLSADWAGARPSVLSRGGRPTHQALQLV